MNTLYTMSYHPLPGRLILRQTDLWIGRKHSPEKKILLQQYKNSYGHAAGMTDWCFREWGNRLVIDTLCIIQKKISSKSSTATFSYNFGQRCLSVYNSYLAIATLIILFFLPCALICRQFCHIFGIAFPRRFWLFGMCWGCQRKP